MINLDYVEYDHNETIDDNSINDSHNDLLNDILIKIKKFGVNGLNTDAKFYLKENIDILVIGPPRVGKSTLIKEITHDQNIEVSGKIDSCTTDVSFYKNKNDNNSIKWWDTPGFENWTKKDIKKFWNIAFTKKRILPIAALICVSTGALGNIELIKFMYDNYLKSSNILTIWCVTKGGNTDIEQTKILFNQGLYIFEEQEKDMITFQPGIAWHNENCQKFIIRLNSKESVINVPNYGNIKIPKFGIATLIKILFTFQKDDTKENLIKLYWKTSSWYKVFISGLVETAYHIGIPEETLFNNKDKSDFFVEIAGESSYNKIKNSIMTEITDISNSFIGK